MAMGLVSKIIKKLSLKSNLQFCLPSALGLSSQRSLSNKYNLNSWSAKNLITVGSLLNYRLAFVDKSDNIIIKFPSIEEVKYAENLGDMKSITNIIKLQTSLEGKRQKDLLRVPHIGVKSASTLSMKYNSGAWKAQDLLAIAAFFNYQLAYVDSNDKVVTKFIPDEQ